jgi:C4-dicarboxylate-specific signal transduction histidine kinase
MTTGQQTTEQRTKEQHGRDLFALREAIALGRQNRLQEALRALLDWLGAEGGGIYCLRNRGQGTSSEGKESSWEIAVNLETGGWELEALDNRTTDNRTTYRIQMGQRVLWVAKVPPEIDRPAYFFVAAFSGESAEPDEVAIQVSAELIASWVCGKEKETTDHRTTAQGEGWEHLARSFRVATLGELAAGIAHEINNPLQVIMGNAELILDTEDLKERTKEKLADILQAAEQIRKIAHSITHFADARRTEEKELLDFNKVVQEAAQLVSYSLVRDGIQVNLELSPVPPIWGRRGDLEEIVVQLVRNAGEAIAESGKGGKVTIRTGVRGNWARLEVEDDGPGVPAELRDRIFDPFVTTKAARGGTGLGLAIVQNLITAHTGRIWLEDSPSGGAKFVVELPLWQISDKGENREEGE